MKQNQYNENGHTALWVLLVLLFIAAAAGAGYYANTLLYGEYAGKREADAGTVIAEQTAMQAENTRELVNKTYEDTTESLKPVLPPQTKEGAERGLSVLMYHNVYDADNPPDDVNANFCSKQALKKHLKYLIDEGYYFPTWEEVRAYIDGKVDLPEKSVVLTFDDGTKVFLKHGVPLLEKYDVRATAFIICSKNGKELAKKKYEHITLQSHSYDMHRPGGNIGHGGVFTALSHDEALDDLKKSIKILGNHDAFAYPFGDYTEECRDVVEEAGFLCAFTTEYGKVYPGDDPMLLPRMRVNGSPTVEEFKELL